MTHHPELVFSRNGFHYQRNYREPFIPRGSARADFDSSSVYAQDVIVHGDRILTYYTGTNGRSPEIALELGDKATTGIGLAVSRLDGFVSLDSGKGWVVPDLSEDELEKTTGERVLFAEPESFGQMVTRPFRFFGSRLHLNASMAPVAAGPGPGEVRVEILRPNFKKLPGFTFGDADPMTPVQSGPRRFLERRFRPERAGRPLDKASVLFQERQALFLSIQIVPGRDTLRGGRRRKSWPSIPSPQPACDRDRQVRGTTEDG